MALFFVTIRTPDIIGPVIYGDWIEASGAQAARDELERGFLKPVDPAIARDDAERQFLEHINARKDEARRQGYIVLARRSKAKQP